MTTHESDEAARVRNIIAHSEALGDQQWEFLKENFSAIKRLADDGPDGSEGDRYLVRSICHHVCAEVLKRRREVLTEELTR